MGLFENAQRARAEQDAARRNEAAGAAEASAKAATEREEVVRAQSRLLREFVAEMTRLGVRPKKHRSTQSYSSAMANDRNYYARKRIGVTGWSFGDCRGCNGGSESCEGIVIGRDALPYKLRNQPEGLFKTPVPHDYPIENLEQVLTYALSRHL